MIAISIKIFPRSLNDTEGVKNTSMVVNSYLWKDESIVFNLNKSDDDPLAIWLRFDTPLDLQKEVELREKQKKRS